MLCLVYLIFPLDIDTLVLIITFARITISSTVDILITLTLLHHIFSDWMSYTISDTSSIPSSGRLLKPSSLTVSRNIFSKISISCWFTLLHTKASHTLLPKFYLVSRKFLYLFFFWHIFEKDMLNTVFSSTKLFLDLLAGSKLWHLEEDN